MAADGCLTRHLTEKFQGETASIKNKTKNQSNKKKKNGEIVQYMDNMGIYIDRLANKDYNKASHFSLKYKWIKLFDKRVCMEYNIKTETRFEYFLSLVGCYRCQLQIITS